MRIGWLAGWLLLVAPVGTPKDVVNKIHKDMQTVLSAPDMAERLKSQGAEQVPMPPDEVNAFIAREKERSAKLIQIGGIKAE